MPDSMPVPLEVALLAVALTAAATDIAMRKIPNWITAPGAVLGLALHAYYGGWHGLLSSLGGGAMGFGIFLILYLSGGMGAGDVKLAAAIGALAGAQSFVLVFIATGMLGGVAAIVLALARGRLRQTLENTGHLFVNFGLLRWREVRKSSSLDAPEVLRLPYGAVIAGGTLAFLTFFH